MPSMRIRAKVCIENESANISQTQKTDKGGSVPIYRKRGSRDEFGFLAFLILEE